MRRRPRTKYTETQKALMWERWKKGETLHQIARLFDRPHTSIRQVLAETGGFRPPERRRSKLALTLAEREEISRRIDPCCSCPARTRPIDHQPGDCPQRRFLLLPSGTG
jgi:hypothetical protein